MSQATQAPGPVCQVANLIPLRGSDPGLRWQPGDQGRVDVEHSKLGSATWRAESVLAPGKDVGEERSVVTGVLRPVGRDVVLVEDRLHRADRLARTAVDTLVGMDVQR